MTSRRVAIITAFVTGLTTLSLGVTSFARQDTQTPDQRIAALKKSLADGQASLRKYEWVETTIISLKGEEKARTQKRCYYGADGKVQKVAMGDAPAAAPPAKGGGRGGGRVKGAIVENKKDDIKDYMEQAAALIHKYVPPAPADIQKAKDAKKVAIVPADQGRVRIELKDYLQPGDKLTLVVNGAANTLAGLNVATYLDKPDDVVSLDVQFAALTDGTGYAGQTTLDAKAKNIRVVIQNTGHRVKP